MFSYVPVVVVELYELPSLRRGLEILAWFIGGDDFSRSARLATGERAYGWMLLPSLKMWAGWAAFWMSLGIACVLAAAGRARDH